MKKLPIKQNPKIVIDREAKRLLDRLHHQTGISRGRLVKDAIQNYAAKSARWGRIIDGDLHTANCRTVRAGGLTMGGCTSDCEKQRDRAQAGVEDRGDLHGVENSPDRFETA